MIGSLLNAIGGMDVGGAVFGFSVDFDLSGLNFETIQQTDTRATVMVSGEVVVSVLGILQAEELPPMPLPMLFEDGVWKACD